MPCFSEEAKDIPQEPPMDWSKPVVSRGFGDSFENTSPDKKLVDQYKSGQVLYLFGDYQKAIAKWLPLVENNFAPAQASMAWLYQMGLGVEKNERKSFELYQLAAKQNNAVAQNNLGVMYEKGIVVRTDKKKARALYELSAKNAYRFGQFNFANMLFDGVGGRQDKAAALIWYKKAAKQQVKQAQEKLSELIPNEN